MIYSQESLLGQHLHCPGCHPLVMSHSYVHFHFLLHCHSGFLKHPSEHSCDLKHGLAAPFFPKMTTAILRPPTRTTPTTPKLMIISDQPWSLFADVKCLVWLVPSWLAWMLWVALHWQSLCSFWFTACHSHTTPLLLSALSVLQFSNFQMPVTRLK